MRDLRQSPSAHWRILILSVSAFHPSRAAAKHWCVMTIRLRAALVGPSSGRPALTAFFLSKTGIMPTTSQLPGSARTSSCKQPSDTERKGRVRRVHNHIHAYTYICIHIHKYKYIYTYIHTYAYIYMYISTYTHIYIHILFFILRHFRHHVTRIQSCDRDKVKDSWRMGGHLPVWACSHRVKAAKALC